MRRRGFLKAVLLSFSAPAAGGSAPQVAVVGGGFGGMAALRALQQHAEVTLIEPHPAYFTCPASNLVVAGFRPLSHIRQTRENLNCRVVRARAVRILPGKAVLQDGSYVTFDRAVVAPGVAPEFDAMPGFSKDDIQNVPHAWLGGADGAQTQILRRQILQVPAGGVFIILPPDEPYSCQPAPYERASLVAARFQRDNPRAKIIIIDPKENFSKQTLFARAWRKLYGDMIEWRGGEAGGIVEALDLRGGKKVVETEFGPESADILNYIPPQKSAVLAQASGLADESGWCPVRPVTFESRHMPGVYVVGDAAATAMPKAASAAQSQGVAAARAILEAFGIVKNSDDDILSAACYSLAGTEYGLASESRYQLVDGALTKLEEKLTPPDAAPARLKQDAEKADAWHSRITAALFG